MSETDKGDNAHSENVSKHESKRLIPPKPLEEPASRSRILTETDTVSEGREEEEEVKDIGHRVFFIFLLFGFGSLLPWNMFLNISYDYYTMFKMRNENGTSTWYSANFQNAMTISAQIPSLVFSVINIFIAVKGDLTFRMKICLLVVQAMVVITVIFIYIKTSEWISAFFVLTLITIIVLNAANGLFQNSMFGLASSFPFKYTNAVIMGQNFCGTAVTALAILTKSVSDDAQMRANLFFGMSSVAVIVCFVFLNILKNLSFFKKYGDLRQSADSDEGDATSSWSDIKLAVSKSKMQLANIYLLFFVTLALFPNVCMYVRDAKPGGKHTFVVPEKYFMDIVTFFNFNLFAFLGSLTANWIRFPGPNLIWIPIVARFWFIFYFPTSNYYPMDYPRHYGVYFESTWLFTGNVSILAISSGYLSSLVMMYAPRSHEEPKMKRITGMIASFFLFFGILCGLVFSWQIRLFVTGYA